MRYILPQNLFENNNYAKKVLKNYGLDESHRVLLQTTHRGAVYEEDGVIIKITTDVVEYNNAVILIKKPSKYFIDYYTANDNGDGSYELTMEEITPLSDDESDMVDIIQNSLGRMDYMLDDNRRYAFIRELKDNPEFYEDFNI